MTKNLKIGSAAVAVIAVVGLVLFVSRMQSQINSKDDEIQILASENAYLAWEKSIKKLEIDTIWRPGTYTEIVDTTEIRDTLYLESGEVGPKYIPEISGFFKVYATRKFGSGPDPFTVAVKGRIYHSAEDSLRNWLLIYRASGRLPQKPVARRSPKSWGLGLCYLRSFNQGQGMDYFGGSVKYKRITLVSGYNPWQKSLIAGVNLNVLSF